MRSGGGRCLFCIVCLIVAMSVFAPGVLAHEGGALPTLRLDAVPPWGVDEPITGAVFNASGDLAVTGYLQVVEGGRVWGPKPTFDWPSEPVDGAGQFSLIFNTGGDDVIAEVIVVLLVPGSFVPDGDYARSEAVALDRLEIRRTQAGEVTVLAREGRWVRPEPTPSPTATAAPTATLAISTKGANPFADAPTISLNYSPYTEDGQNPDLNSTIPLVQMAQQLDALRPYVDTIRAFGVTGELRKLYPLARNQYGYRVIAGCWIGPDHTPQQTQTELDTLIDVANRGECDLAVVGSECLYRGDVTEAELIGYLAYVREGIADPGIAVATSDTAQALLDHHDAGAASDVIMATYYPFYEGVPIEEAAQALQAEYARLVAAYPGKRVIISETGWPTAGTPEGQAVPSEANAARYFQEVYAWAEAKGVEVVFFSAFDESWKVEGSAGDIGSHWGHFTGAGNLKAGYRVLAGDSPYAQIQHRGPTVAESIADLYRMAGNCVGREWR